MQFRLDSCEEGFFLNETNTVQFGTRNKITTENTYSLSTLDQTKLSQICILIGEHM